jgi:putative transposase
MYWTGAHTKHRHMYHIIWVPKYRKRILRERIAERIEELLRECASMNRWEIHELSIQVDHVHMLIQLRPDVSVSKAVQLFKDGSSKVIREEFPELQEFLWEDSFWADGYFSETVGKINIDVVREYIKNQ